MREAIPKGFYVITRPEEPSNAARFRIEAVQLMDAVNQLSSTKTKRYAVVARKTA